jgi:isopenicillin N synthase-like dioxygenase
MQLPKEHFRQSHSFGLNTAMSLIHYPRLSDTERAEMNMTDIRAGGEDAECHEAERGRLRGTLMYLHLEHKDWGTMTLR